MLLHSFSFFVCVRAPVCVCIGVRTIAQLARPWPEIETKALLILLFFLFRPLDGRSERENIRAQSRLADSFIFLSVPDSRKKEGEYSRGAPYTAFDTCGAR